LRGDSGLYGIHLPQLGGICKAGRLPAAIPTEFLRDVIEIEIEVEIGIESSVTSFRFRFR
jgi:hypothetical protein